MLFKILMILKINKIIKNDHFLQLIFNYIFEYNNSLNIITTISKIYYMLNNYNIRIYFN